MGRQSQGGGVQQAMTPWWMHAVMASALAATALMGLGLYEGEASRWQSAYFSQQAQELRFTVEEGPAPNLLTAPKGPHDQRLGYTELEATLARLESLGFEITAQARNSSAHVDLVASGVFPIYPVKSQAGLTLRDRNGEPVYDFRYPSRLFEDYDAIPPIVVDTLLFIENRRLLDEELSPLANPAVDARRLLRAVIDQALAAAGSSRDAPGGSTLATQMEKYRHSQSGRTESVQEKWRQMLSASYRAYLDGPETVEASRRIVTTYLDSVPLGARTGWGEVHGFGDGLWVWFGAELQEVSETLSQPADPADEEAHVAYARAYRMVLSLILAQQRPAVFLPGRIDQLNERTAMFLRVLAREGVISQALRDEALKWPVTLGPAVTHSVHDQLVEEKVLDDLKANLSSLLGKTSTHELVRMDVDVETTLDTRAHQKVAEVIASLRDPSFVGRHGLDGRTRMGAGEPDDLIFSVMLFERGEAYHRLRLKVDSHPGRLDLNEGSKLDLGSTAKLRTLTHYLEVVEGLFHELNDSGARDDEWQPSDPLTRWADSYLSRHPDADLEQWLDAAMRRRYSANPRAVFWTGGGDHRFQNASRRHDGQVLTVAQAFAESANLPFVRLMEDLVRYHIERLPEAMARILDAPDDPRREPLLRDFAQNEGRIQVRQFFERFRGASEQEIFELVVEGRPRTPSLLTWLYRQIRPEGTLEELDDFLRRYGHRIDEEALTALYEGFDRDGRNEAPDVDEDVLHPIELWAARFALENPEATVEQAIAASAEAREAALDWLARTDSDEEAHRRVYAGLEAMAFERIHEAWQRVGYPFDSLVPSLATALGSSADRPAALAELMGILLSDGKRLPMLRFEAMHFAMDTPFEVRLERVLEPNDEASVTVLSVEVVQVLRSALETVVTSGTGRALRSGLAGSNGQSLVVAGKTGTADHRFHFFDRDGERVGSRAVNRTATWVFSIGQCHFGTIVAYVPGSAASEHTFMSALTVRLLAVMEPALESLLIDGDSCQPGAAR
jgi:membrane peptidoglycan carboxypeptidase